MRLEENFYTVIFTVSTSWEPTCENGKILIFDQGSGECLRDMMRSLLWFSLTIDADYDKIYRNIALCPPLDHLNMSNDTVNILYSKRLVDE